MSLNRDCTIIEMIKTLAPLCYSRIIHKNNGPGGPLPSESRVTYTPTLSKRATVAKKCF